MMESDYTRGWRKRRGTSGGHRKKEKENRTRLKQNLEDSWRQATAQSIRLQQDQPDTSGRGARMEERKRGATLVVSINFLDILILFVGIVAGLRHPHYLPGR